MKKKQLLAIPLLLLAMFGCSSTTPTYKEFKKSNPQLELQLLSMVNDKYPSLPATLKKQVDELIKNGEITLLSVPAQSVINNYMVLNNLDKKLSDQKGTKYPKIEKADLDTLRDMEKKGKVEVLSNTSQNVWNIFKLKDPILTSGVTEFENFNNRLINIYNKKQKLYEVNSNDLEVIKTIANKGKLELLEKEALIIANYNINLDKVLQKNSLTLDSIRDLENKILEISKGNIILITNQDYNLLKNLQSDKLNLLNIFGNNLLTSTENHLKLMKSQVDNINQFITNYYFDLIEGSDSKILSNFINILNQSTSVINMKNFPSFQNLKVGTKCISTNRGIVECNPRDYNQLWIMDINGRITNFTNNSICMSNKNDNSAPLIDNCINSSNFIIETVTINNITKSYLKSNKANKYVSIVNNELSFNSDKGNDNNIYNLIQLKDPIWSMVLSDENKKILLNVLGKNEKIIYQDIDNMEQRIVVNYSDRAYPLLTKSESLLMDKLSKDNHLYILNDNASLLINNYLNAKKQADKLEKFVADNKNKIESKEPQTIQTLLDIAATAPFAIDINQPIYLPLLMNNFAYPYVSNRVNGSYIVFNYTPYNHTSYWVMDAYGRITSKYQFSKFCMEVKNAEPGRGDANITFSYCNTNREQIFEAISNSDNTTTFKGFNTAKNKIVYIGYGNGRLSTDDDTSSSYTKFTNFREDRSFFWLLTPETRQLLANILEEKNKNNY